MLTAVLDTSVLWPSRQRDFLLSMAAEGAYAPKWSAAILDELVYHEEKKLINRGATQTYAKQLAQNLIHTMAEAFDNALVVGWEPLEGAYNLPDPDDEHVLAAAVKCEAELIVTQNLKDFPPSRLPATVRAISPKEFSYDIVRTDIAQARKAVTEICNRSGQHGPELTVIDFLSILHTRYSMTATVQALAKTFGLEADFD